ncbi:DUF3037 domain-containing protein [Labrenzia sp. OB1]|uniref:DUF3037 domain-containing protein n=1 Tax=Labrenzia sp. OB1 TaxID=1561204 RepID=UPI0007B22D9E|nr:DUF3037 domain-containing protein [Labrenzia sp. OB1]KZM47618.1 hypothetical protein OA90_25010 [Labrenzia sp. OB1]
MGSVGQYAILRFRPFPETGEFANVGVVAWAPSSREFSFKIAPKNFARVKNFFRELEANVLKETLSSFEKELNRLHSTLYDLDEIGFHSALTHFTRPRETIFNFSEVRSVRVKNSLQHLCEILYEKYVGRDFVTKEYREQWMEKNIRTILLQNQMPEFTKQRVNTPLFPIDLPLVYKNLGELYIIKPLAFDQDSPARMFDHGQRWNARIRALLDTSTLKESNILVPVEGPVEIASRELKKTYRYVTKELRQLQIPIVNFEDTQEIVKFAENLKFGQAQINKNIH